jgi:hypothetical protein
VDLPDRGRRKLFDQLTRFLNTEESVSTPHDVPPRLTFQALESIRMSRSRERILTNLEEMYREAFDRAKESGDPARWRRSISRIAASSCTSRSCSMCAMRLKSGN